MTFCEKLDERIKLLQDEALESDFTDELIAKLDCLYKLAEHHWEWKYRGKHSSATTHHTGAYAGGDRVFDFSGGNS